MFFLRPEGEKSEKKLKKMYLIRHWLNSSKSGFEIQIYLILLSN